MKNKKTVKLICKGYTWSCPTCGIANDEEELEETVECINCTTEFLIDFLI